MVSNSRIKTDRAKLTPLQVHLAEEAYLTENERPHRRARPVGNALVAAQLLLMGACVAPVGPAMLTPIGFKVLGLALIATGLLVGVLAAVALGRSLRAHPIPADQGKLRTSGVYALVRHPMYLAVLLTAVGLTLLGGHLLALFATLALAAVLAAKAKLEEGLLYERFGWEYATYCSRVPAILPRIRRRW